MNCLDREVGSDRDSGGLSQALENAVHDVHECRYPINGYFLQSPYPIFFDAPTVPSWHGLEMHRDGASQFDRDAMRARMKELGLTQKGLAEKIGVHQSAVSNILNGGRGVKVHEAAAIERALGMERTTGVVMVPSIGITSAGNWREAVDVPGRRVPIPQGIAGANAFAVEHSGDSMDQVLNPGAYIVVDPDLTQLYNDKVYLIENDEHETQVKLYRSNPARFEPRSSNDTHQTLFMGECHVKVIGRVVWQGMPM